MKAVKITRIVLLLIIGTPLLVALFVSNEMQAEVSIEIDRPRMEVFEYVRLLKNQRNYSKWEEMDPENKVTYSGTDGEVGFISAWESAKTGKGEQEIVALVPNERIDFAMRFKEPFESEADVYMLFESITDDRTKLSWGFSGKTPYPFNIFLLFMDFSEAIADDYRHGLEKLKGILEEGN
jgi:uncharacterized protein YndB with AHSA1/START domain